MKPHFTNTPRYSEWMTAGWVIVAAAIVLYAPLRLLQLAGGL